MSTLKKLSPPLLTWFSLFFFFSWPWGSPAPAWPLCFLCPLQQQALSPVPPVLMFLRLWGSLRSLTDPFLLTTCFMSALLVQGSPWGAVSATEMSRAQDRLCPGQAPWHSTAAAPSLSLLLLLPFLTACPHTFPWEVEPSWNVFSAWNGENIFVCVRDLLGVTGHFGLDGISGAVRSGR